MRCIRLKYKCRNIWRMLCIYAGFPQVWVFIIIFILTITMFAFSFQSKSDYWASLCSNIFAGLVTGLVLSLLSGVRQIYVSIQQKKIDWLQQLHQMILDYYSIKHDFMSGNYRGQDKEDFIYDMGAHLSWIKDSIVQDSFDRRLPFNATKYCKKAYGFDASSFTEKSEFLRASLCACDYSDKNSIWTLFKDIDKEVSDLNHKICNDIRDSEEKIATAQRSVI